MPLISVVGGDGMKKWFLNLTCVSILLFGVSACSNSNEEENIKKAESYYEKGQFEDAIKIYENLYDKTNDTKYLDEIDIVKNDQKVLATITDFRATLKEIVDTKVRKGAEINIHDLKVITEDLIKKMDEFDRVEVSENHVAYNYLNEVRGSNSYTFLNKFTREQYDNALTDPKDAITNAGEFANTITISIFRDDIYGMYIPEILEINPPE